MFYDNNYIFDISEFINFEFIHDEKRKSKDDVIEITDFSVLDEENNNVDERRLLDE